MVLRPNSLKSIFVGRSLFARLKQEYFLTIADQQLVAVLEIFPVSEEEESEVEEEDSDASSMDVDSDDSESADDED